MESNKENPIFIWTSVILTSLVLYLNNVLDFSSFENDGVRWLSFFANPILFILWVASVGWLFNFFLKRTTSIFIKVIISLVFLATVLGVFWILITDKL